MFHGLSSQHRGRQHRLPIGAFLRSRVVEISQVFSHCLDASYQGMHRLYES